MQGTDYKRSVESLRGLAARQRELNDQQVKARREAWDQHLANVSSAAEVEFLYRELAVNPVAW
jgi:hypothetical protein